MPDDELRFDPNERVVPHSTESYRAKTDGKTPSQNTSPVQRRTAPPTVSAPPQTRGTATPESTKQNQATRQQVVAALEARAEPEPEQPDQVLPKGTVHKRLPLLVDSAENRVPTVDHTDVWLPSGFVGYEWDSIQIRRFTVREVRAIAQARGSGSLRHLIRAIDATITRPVTDLTAGDFWYLMYWHRLNSYKKSPFIITWTCTDPTHLESVQKGREARNDMERQHVDSVSGLYMVEERTLKNVESINESKLNVTNINVDAYNDMAQRLMSEYGISVRPAMLLDFITVSDEEDDRAEARKLQQETMRARARELADAGDVDALLQVEDEISSLMESWDNDDVDREFMYRYAAVLETVHGQTLDERVEYLSSLPPDVLDDLELLLKTVDHGVNESWTVKCRECSASKTVNQSLDALTFLPSLQG